MTEKRELKSQFRPDHIHRIVQSLNESPLLRMLCLSVSFTFLSLFPVLSVLYAVVIDRFNQKRLSTLRF